MTPSRVARIAATFSIAIGLSLFAGAVPAVATERVDRQIQSIELVGGPDTRFVIGERRYAGPITFTLFTDGISLSETASIEQYLEGIAEMPFSWPTQALQAQAVAARTYLARTLLPGRGGDGADHEYDICATSRCQVYRGVSLVEGPSGERWRAAVQNTADELVLYEGKPIEAVFTSMVGSRSRANQDVWSSAPVPYLQPVDSPEVGIAPYAEWSVEITADEFVAILMAEGLDVGGELEGISVDDPVEGDGRTTITITTSEGTDEILAPHLKGAFNRFGDELFPGLLPMRLEEGKKLPEPLPSYTFDVERVGTLPSALEEFLAPFDLVGVDSVVISGEGWGHGVGMSQWGARIFADQGVSYDEILSHYYSGLEPESVPDLVPDEVVVGLATQRSHYEVIVEGEAEIRVNGIASDSFLSGEWLVREWADGLIIVSADDPGSTLSLFQRFWPF
ncbi:MAG: SpoIID/LytB domain-containing protein [Actinomycetia bacterium]|nr:SpoIID/LytB domain-containing protein [Actinomycetes bacterium]